jgi:hypothetical protein
MSRFAFTYTLTDRDDPVTVVCGLPALAATDRELGGNTIVDGLDAERIMYACWWQSVRDAAFLGPFSEFVDRLVDVTPGTVPDPTRAAAPLTSS